MKTVVVLASLLLVGCGATMWIPVEVAPRRAVSIDAVQFLEAEPTRAYVVVGIITPPTGEYETEAEAVRAMRREAAKHGADAMFIESRTPTGGWSFSASPWGASGGSGSDTVFRAKAIAWK